MNPRVHSGAGRGCGLHLRSSGSGDLRGEPMSDVISVLFYAGLTLVIGLGMVFAARIFGPRKHQQRKMEPYECGVPILSSSRERFPVHFYLVAILFILFDLETVFLIPWAILCPELGLGGLAAMFTFLGIIVFGLVYEWKRGALEWE